MKRRKRKKEKGEIKKRGEGRKRKRKSSMVVFEPLYIVAGRLVRLGRDYVYQLGQ